MEFFDNFFNVVKEDGKVLSSISMKLNKDLSHAEVLKMFINNYEDFKNYPSGFYEGIDKFSNDDNTEFLTNVFNSVTSGKLVEQSSLISSKCANCSFIKFSKLAICLFIDA